VRPARRRLMALPQVRAPPCQRSRPSVARHRRFPIDLVKTWLVEDDLQVRRALAGEKVLPAPALVPADVPQRAGRSSKGKAPELGPALLAGPVCAPGDCQRAGCQDGKAVAAGAGAATRAAAATPGSAAAKVASALVRHTGLSLLGWGRASDAASPVRP